MATPALQSQARTLLPRYADYVNAVKLGTAENQSNFIEQWWFSVTNLGTQQSLNAASDQLGLSLDDITKVINDPNSTDQQLTDSIALMNHSMAAFDDLNATVDSSSPTVIIGSSIKPPAVAESLWNIIKAFVLQHKLIAVIVLVALFLPYILRDLGAVLSFRKETT